MAISRKPKPQDNTVGKGNVDIEALINKGGSVGGETGSKYRTQTSTINIRVPVPLVERIDQELEGRPIRTPRHTWLLEAVWEKLERDETNYHGALIGETVP